MKNVQYIGYASKRLNILDILFIFFCMVPFIFPNPIITTDMQPYAAIMGTLVIAYDIYKNDYKIKIVKPKFFAIAFLTFIVSFIILLLGEISISDFRAVFNYYSLAVIPFATFTILCKIGEYPEKIVKILIIVWFFVGSIQFFIDRSFLSKIIAGARFSYKYRGVLGLASEPSFFGIACFYFMHMIKKFKTNQVLFLLIAVLMGVLYAQSMMGVIFIIAYIAIYLLDVINTKKGIYIWIGAVAASIAFFVMLNTVLAGTRLHQLILTFLEGGFDSMLEDGSAEVRFNSLTDAIKTSFENYLLPLGYTKRIGSGYGGFLCELGFFALPVLIGISYSMARGFDKKYSRILYFIIVTILLFNNTQIGNPLMLFVIGINLALPAMNRTE